MKQIFAVYDRKIQSVALIKDAESLYDFERWFAITFLNSPTNLFACFPDDFLVYSLCLFYDEKVEITEDKTLVCADVSEIMDLFKITRPNLARDPD